MTPSILQTFELGDRWPTLDPFLFCVHHVDRYPAGNAEAGPAASLAGRELGSDFEGRDGWRMYHGSTVPGFPAHPHRGFETITIVRTGLVDHADSLGAQARYGRGDVQWLTAGKGIQHSEMFPLLDRDGSNPLEVFQIWLNLPAASKRVDPHFTMFWADQIPVVETPGVRVDVIAGRIDGVDPLAPPPDSWAARHDSDVAVWRATLAAGATWHLPASGADVGRVVFAYEGSVSVDGQSVGPLVGAAVDARARVEVSAGADGAELLVLQGRPIGEPVAQYGPFVMNTQAEIAQAFEDYRKTQFGGWPWPNPDPVHGPSIGRFAEHVGGRRETPGS